MKTTFIGILLLLGLGLVHEADALSPVCLPQGSR
jgi:hypothetical protein